MPNLRRPDSVAWICASSAFDSLLARFLESAQLAQPAFQLVHLAVDAGVVALDLRPLGGRDVGQSPIFGLGLGGTTGSHACGLYAGVKIAISR